MLCTTINVWITKNINDMWRFQVILFVVYEHVKTGCSSSLRGEKLIIIELHTQAGTKY